MPCSLEGITLGTRFHRPCSLEGITLGRRLPALLTERDYPTQKASPALLTSREHHVYCAWGVTSGTRPMYSRHLGTSDNGILQSSSN